METTMCFGVYTDSYLPTRHSCGKGFDSPAVVHNTTDDGMITKCCLVIPHTLLTPSPSWLSEKHVRTAVFLTPPN